MASENFVGLPCDDVIIGNELFLCPLLMRNMELSRLLCFAGSPGARLRGRATPYSGPAIVIEFGPSDLELGVEPVG